MPTGYTANLTTESSFRDFALSFARQFGALIHMRDEPSSAPLTLPELSDHHSKALVKAKASLGALGTMAPAELREANAADFLKRTAEYASSCARAQATRDAYRAMLAKVKSWQPPSAEHEGLKANMIRHLKESDEFDNSILDRPERAPQPQTVGQWFDAAEKAAQWEIDYHTKGQADDVQLIAARRAWIQSLLGSLPES